MTVEFAQRAAVLRERATTAPPTSWRPDKRELGHPDPLVGELMRVETGHTSYGPKTIAVVRDVEGREWSVWLLATVLADEFRRQAPQIGELLAVRYEGRVRPQAGGTAYAKYRLVVDRGDAGIDWGAPDDHPGAPASVPAASDAVDEDVPF
jgi:hypothetical protein